MENLVPLMLGLIFVSGIAGLSWRPAKKGSAKKGQVHLLVAEWENSREKGSGSFIWNWLINPRME